MHIVIIGNGISGITAARYCRKLGDDQITVISSESAYFFSRTALMYIYMGHMRFEDTKPYQDHFWEKNRISLVQDYVSAINFKDKSLRLQDSRTVIQYDRLILALGSSPNKFGWPGQDLEGVQGLYSIQNLEYIEKKSNIIKRAIIVGGGLIGIELAEMFHSRNIEVTFLVREKNYWDIVLPDEESKMVAKHIIEQGIDLKLSTELKEIHSDDHGHCNAVTTNQGEKIDCEFVGLTAGVHPNVHFLKNTPLEIQKGIMVDGYLQTNIHNVYAIGDCAQLRKPKRGRRSIEAVWYTGRMMGETVAYNIYNKRIEYDPGIWFNSAKFFDIEYQVYGTIEAKNHGGQEQFYWEGKKGKRSFRIAFDPELKHVLGFNLMGIRFRHEVCEKWIKTKTSVIDVMKDIALANFDPEFFPSTTEEIQNAFSRQYGVNIDAKNKPTYNDVHQFLTASNH